MTRLRVISWSGLVSSALLSSTLLCPGAAWAGPRQQACNALIADGAHLEAARCIDVVQASQPAPINLMRAAQLYAHTDHAEEAIERFEAYLATGDTAFADAAREHLDGLYRRARGRIHAQCADPDARVFVDGAAIGACDATSGWLRVGERRVELVIGGRIVRNEIVLVVAGETVPGLQPPPSVEPGAPIEAARVGSTDDPTLIGAPVDAPEVDWLAWTTLGAGVVGLGVGGYAHIRNVQLADDYRRDIENESLAGLVDATFYASIIGYGIGAVASVFGLIRLLDEPSTVGSLTAMPGGAIWSMTW